MKVGVRKPSIKKSIKARTTAKVKRKVKKAVIPAYGKKGTGIIKDPKKAIYNKVYNKTTISVVPSILDNKSAKNSKKSEDTFIKSETGNIYKTSHQTAPNVTESNQDSIAFSPKVSVINKHIFVWIGTFCFGYLGVDRFMRGQILIGILKLLFNWLTLGLWGIIDWIIAIVKSYSTFSDTEEITFINGKYSR